MLSDGCLKILAKCHFGDKDDHEDLFLNIKHQDESYVVAKAVYDQHMKKVFKASGSVTERRSNPGNYSRQWFDEIHEVFTILPDCKPKLELLHSIKVYKKIRFFFVKQNFYEVMFFHSKNLLMNGKSTEKQN